MNAPRFVHAGKIAEERWNSLQSAQITDDRFAARHPEKTTEREWMISNGVKNITINEIRGIEEILDTKLMNVMRSVSHMRTAKIPHTTALVLLLDW